MRKVANTNDANFSRPNNPLFPVQTAVETIDLTTATLHVV